jgi:fumarate hydratase class II
MTKRIEKDPIGEIEVDDERLWGAQTERALRNFKIGLYKLPIDYVHAIALVKQAAARAHLAMGTLPREMAIAIEQAAAEIVAGQHDGEFPIPVWQTGSGTQSNMNVNEVIANRASEILGGGRGQKRLVHPNDHVNLGQSSNDVMPTALHIAVIPALDDAARAVAHLRAALADRIARFGHIVKIGRTHYMDATPVTMGQEMGAWVTLLDRAARRIAETRNDLLQVALGGTAVGTGLNAPPGFAERTVVEIAKLTGQPFTRAPDPFAALSVDDAPVAAHGALHSLAVVLVKIANDLRFLASGPRSGIAELQLPENEPGSSIMPGKVNPTQPEAVVQVCILVMGNDAAIGFAGTQALAQLSLTRPLVAFLLLSSARLLADACRSLADHCIAGMEPNERRIKELVERSLMLVTALTPHIGYDKAAKIAKHAHAEGLTLRESALQLGFVSAEDYDRWVKPEDMV